VRRITSLVDLSDELAGPPSGLSFLYVTTQPRQNGKLPRPDISPASVANRFRNWLQATQGETVCSLPRDTRNLSSNCAPVEKGEARSSFAAP
jgi:hypothetical protein